MTEKSASSISLPNLPRNASVNSSSLSSPSVRFSSKITIKTSDSNEINTATLPLIDTNHKPLPDDDDNLEATTPSKHGAKKKKKKTDKGSTGNNKEAKNVNNGDVSPTTATTATTETIYLKPLHYDAWIRSMDDSGNIYYFNSETNESSWLMPCSTCYRPADKWCVQCMLSFCDKHFQKKHKDLVTDEVRDFSAAMNALPVDATNENGSTKSGKSNKSTKAMLKSSSKRNLGSFSKNQLDSSEISKYHQWTTVEIEKRAELKGDEEYCIECHLKVATKVCSECWDCYCTKCFDLVHHVGALKLHKVLPYRRARSTWYTVRKGAGEADYYVNGETKETTYDKVRWINC